MGKARRVRSSASGKASGSKVQNAVGLRQRTASGQLKKTKQQLKHKLLLQRLEAQKTATDAKRGRNAKKAAEAAKSQLDLSSLQSALKASHAGVLLGSHDGHKAHSAKAAMAQDPLMKACVKRVNSRKARTQALIEESQQLNTVLSHPTFAVQPLGAITEHLKNMVQMQKKAKDVASSAQRRKDGR